MKLFRRNTIFFATFLGFVGCGSGSSGPPQSSIFKDEVIATRTAVTYQRADGNRVAPGEIDLESATRITIPVDGTPKWLLSSVVENDSVWVVVLSSGDVLGYKLHNETISRVDVIPTHISSDVLPILIVDTENHLYLANVTNGDLRGAGPTAYLEKNSSGHVFVDIDGNLVLRHQDIVKKIPLDAPSNARLLVDEQQRVLLLTSPSVSRYSHQVLGSDSNMTKIVMVETKDRFEQVLSIDISEPKVIEGNALIWADTNGDGTREIVTTISDATRGAYVAVFDSTSGNEIARSADIGQGFRWRIQVAVGAFDTKTTEIFSVLFPHIGGVLEFFRMENESLIARSANIGLTAHRNINQNIDMSMAGNFSPRAGLELLVPSYNFKRLGVVTRDGDTITEIASVDVQTEMTSNPSAVETNGKMILGVGYQNGIAIWR